jgi:serpin B
MFHSPPIMRFLASLWLSLLPFYGCSEPPLVEELRSAKEPFVDPPLPSGAMAAEVEANNAFTWDLYHGLAQDPENIIFSPVAIRLAASIAYAGSAGRTWRQIRDVFYFSPSLGQVFKRLNHLTGEFQTRASTGPNLRLALAEAIWLQKHMPYAASFLDRLALYLNQGIKAVNYHGERPAAIEEAMRQWFAERLFNSDKLPLSLDLDASTNMVLTSVAALELSLGATLPGSPPLFQGANGAASSLPFVCRRYHGEYAHTAQYELLKIPFAEEHLSLLLLLPVANSFPDVERALDPWTLEKMTRQLVPRTFSLLLPQIALTSATSLRLPLIELGMKDAFAASLADFSHLSKSSRFFLSSLEHAASLRTVAAGGETAAHACPAEGSKDRRESVIVDRPFLFIVRDDAHGAIVLIGRYRGP